MKHSQGLRRVSTVFSILAGICFILTACNGPHQSDGNEIRIDTINTATPVERLIRSEDIPVENCGGTGSAHRTIARTKTVNSSISIGRTAQIEGGGEVEIPEIIKANLKASISQKYANQIFEGTQITDEIEVEVAAGTHVIYTIEWVQESYTSTVRYVDGTGRTYIAPYTYKVEVPKQNGSKNVPCPTPTQDASAAPQIPPAAEPVTPSPPPTEFLGGGSGQLVFSAWQNGSQYNSQIYLLNLGTGLDTIDTDHIINLSNNMTMDEDPSWSPDGNQILFVSRRDGDPEIYIMDANGKNQTNITRHPDRDYQPVWSPDGYYIAFSSYRGPGANQDIFIMKSNGTDIRQISETGRYYQDPTWSRDSQKIFFVGWDKDRNKDKAEIFVYDIGSGNMRELTDLDKLSLYPDVSPDGKLLVFVSTYAGFKNLFLIGTDGYNRQQLTQQTKTNYIEPAWSPDGKWIAFVAEGENNQNTLYLFNLNTRKKYAIITLPGLHNPAWRP